MPIVSIITPAYNASKTILETYESIKSQTFSDWEWIITNDCSKDNTLEILNKIAEDDPRVIIINAKVNGGAALSRNLAIEKAKGRYIAFLDADDLWVPTKLEKQIKYMLDNGYACVCSNYEVFSDDGTVYTYNPKKSVIDYKNLLRGSKIG